MLPFPERETDAAGFGGPLLTVPQLHELLAERGVAVSTSTLYDWLNAGYLPCARVGQGRYLIHRAEVLDWLEHGRINRWRQPQPRETVVRLDPAPLVDVLIEALTFVRRRRGAA